MVLKIPPLLKNLFTIVAVLTHAHIFFIQKVYVLTHMCSVYILCIYCITAFSSTELFKKCRIIKWHSFFYFLLQQRRNIFVKPLFYQQCMYPFVHFPSCFFSYHLIFVWKTQPRASRSALFLFYVNSLFSFLYFCFCLASFFIQFTMISDET